MPAKPRFSNLSSDTPDDAESSIAVVDILQSGGIFLDDEAGSDDAADNDEPQRSPLGYRGWVSWTGVRLQHSSTRSGQRRRARHCEDQPPSFVVHSSDGPRPTTLAK